MSESSTLTRQDYAALQFEASLTHAQAIKAGGDTLSQACVHIRTALIICSKSKQELMDSFGNDQDTLMDIIEAMPEVIDYLESLKDIVTSAHARLLSVANIVIEEDEEEQIAA